MVTCGPYQAGLVGTGQIFSLGERVLHAGDSTGPYRSQRVRFPLALPSCHPLRCVRCVELSYQRAF